jgi:hypothetical protein
MTAQWASFLMTAVLAGLTGAYVVLTRELVISERKAYITVRLGLRPDNPNLLFLDIRNTGKGVGRDIALAFDPDAPIIGRTNLTRAVGRIPALLPGESFAPIPLGSALNLTALADRLPAYILTV